MHNRIKRLEELVKGSVERIQELQEENALLKKQVQAMAEDRQKMIKNASSARELRQLKDKLRKKLSRITERIDRELTLQGALFAEDFDDNQ